MAINEMDWAPTVSVIIPAYNAASWLKETLQSVLNQTYHDFEIVLVDDGSVDDTHQVIQTIHDKRLRYIYQKNHGLSSARNTGIRASSGKYISLLDADDLFKPSKLEKQVALLESDPNVGILTCGFELVDEQGQKVGEECHWLLHPTIDLESLLFWNPLLPSTLLIRRTWFDRAGLFDETLRRYEDWEFAVRMAFAGCKMGYVKEILLSYRRHSTNMSTASALVPVATECALKFMMELYQHPDIPISVLELRHKVFGNIYLDASARAYGAEMGELGEIYLLQALSLDPDLNASESPKWITALIGYALGNLVLDPASYIKYVSSHLPRTPEFKTWSRRRLTAHLLAAQAFEMLVRGEKPSARSHAVQAIISDFRLIKNRGLVKIPLLCW